MVGKSRLRLRQGGQDRQHGAVVGRHVPEPPARFTVEPAERPVRGLREARGPRGAAPASVVSPSSARRRTPSTRRARGSPFRGAAGSRRRRARFTRDAIDAAPHRSTTQVRKARREKKFDEAIKEIDGRRVEITDETVVVEATDDKPALVHLCVEVDRGITFDDAVTRLAEAKKDATAAAPSTRLGAIRRKDHSAFYISKNPSPITKKRLVMMALQSQSYVPGESSFVLRIFRPKTGVGQMQLTDVLQRYVRTDPENVKEAWGAEYVDPNCSHGAKCKNKKTCEVGKRVQHKHLLCGSLLDSMRKAEGIIARRYASSGHCNVCRVIEKKNDEPTADGRRALGLEIYGIYIDEVLDGFDPDVEA